MGDCAHTHAHTGARGGDLNRKDIDPNGLGEVYSSIKGKRNKGCTVQFSKSKSAVGQGELVSLQGSAPGSVAKWSE